MISNLDYFFIQDEDAFYINSCGEKRFRGVNRYYGDTLRNDKAAMQASLPAVPQEFVLNFINEFLACLLPSESDHPQKALNQIVLDGVSHPVIGNGIVISGCSWISPVWDTAKRRYTKYDPKYDVIKQVFGLRNANDLVWVKFTQAGHVGVVAKGFDINFGYQNSSGKLVREVGQKWDDSFVLVFPLLPCLLNKYSCSDIELGIGNYLISKQVPIIDYYSHNN